MIEIKKYKPLIDGCMVCSERPAVISEDNTIGICAFHYAINTMAESAMLRLNMSAPEAVAYANRTATIMYDDIKRGEYDAVSKIRTS